MSDAPLLTIKNGRKFYGRQLAMIVDNLEIEQGERIVVYGQNGCGKSTLLQIVAGLTSIDSGNLSRSAKWHDLSIGYLPQNGGIYRDLTVLGYQRVVQNLLGDRSDTGRSASLLDGLGLTPIVHKTLGELSGGYRRLSAIYGLLNSRANALVLDEPFESLDLLKVSAVGDVLRTVAAEYIFILVSAHATSTLQIEERAFWSKEITLNRPSEDVSPQT